MNQLVIIGNLCSDPVSRTTKDGKNVTTFTVAVNRRKSANANVPDADFFRVNAWGALGDYVKQWGIKGRKIAVEGRVTASAYQAQNGEIRANLDVFAEHVEFLSPGNQAPQDAPQPATAQDFRGQQRNNPQPPGGGFVQVDEESLPF